MCAKLKCCLNYEVDDYIEASRKLPGKDIHLHTMDAEYFLFKTDILNGLCTYSTDKNLAVNLETIPVERAKEIIEMNRLGEKPLSLLNNGQARPVKKPIDLLAEADLSRFDKDKTYKKSARRNGKRNGQLRNQERNQQNADTNGQNGQSRQRRNGKSNYQSAQQRNQQQKSTNRNRNE